MAITDVVDPHNRCPYCAAQVAELEGEFWCLFPGCPYDNIRNVPISKFWTTSVKRWMQNNPHIVDRWTRVRW